MENPWSFDSSMIAPCGMNCGLCLGYQREKNKCGGCNGSDSNKPAYCVSCSIRNCEQIQKCDSKLCYECSKLPCARMKQLDKRYRTKYGMSMLENLAMIKNSGMDAFLENEKVKWTCKHCGGAVCVHRDFCLKCKGLKVEG